LLQHADITGTIPASVGTFSKLVSMCARAREGAGSRRGQCREAAPHGGRGRARRALTCEPGTWTVGEPRRWDRCSHAHMDHSRARSSRSSSLRKWAPLLARSLARRGASASRGRFASHGFARVALRP
jgi:hypothetical protein